MDQAIRSGPGKEPEDLRTTRSPPEATWSRLARTCGAPTHLRSLMFWEVARFLVTTLRIVDILISEVRRDQSSTSSASSTLPCIRVASTPSPQRCQLPATLATWKIWRWVCSQKSTKDGSGFLQEWPLRGQAIFSSTEVHSSNIKNGEHWAASLLS